MGIESMVMGDTERTALAMLEVGWVFVVDGVDVDGKVYALFLHRDTYCWDFSDAAQEPTYPQSCKVEEAHAI